MSRLTKGTRKNSSHDAQASAEKADASTLHSFPLYEEGKVPQYHKYHANVSYMDELELIWGKRWGAQGIGRLREVAMVRPCRGGSQEIVRRRFRLLACVDLPTLVRLRDDPAP